MLSMNKTRNKYIRTINDITTVDLVVNLMIFYYIKYEFF